VNGGDDGRAGKDRAEILQQGASCLAVEALGGLVEQQEARVAQVGLGDAEPAPLATRESLAARADLRSQVDVPGLARKIASPTDSAGKVIWKAAVVANCQRDRSTKVVDGIFFWLSSGPNSRAKLMR
jgi:hypothetical protein